MTRSSVLDQIHADWQARHWPLTDLAAFRMEGEGGDGAGGAGGEGSGGAGGQGEGAQGGGGTDWQAEAEKWKTQARKHEDRAKANAAAQTELEKLKQSQMSDQEKAVAQAKADAKAEARAELVAEMGPKLIAAEIRAAAAGRLEDEQISTLIDGLNVAAFLTADGEVDTDKVTKFVDGIAPARDGNDGQPNRLTLDLGQGTRNGGGGDKALNGDPLVRDLKAKLGVR